MSVLVLHTEIMPYGIAILSRLADLVDSDITVVYQDQNRKRGFQPRDTGRIRFLPRSKQSSLDLHNLYTSLQPRLIYVAGWANRDYLKVARRAKRDGVNVVTGLDNQWRGDLRQRVACWVAPFHIGRCFTHVQVAGVRQYEFARRLGFRPHQIRTDLYSCDMQTFGKPKATRTTSPKRFLFVGRFDPVKGLDELFSAWREITRQPCEWTLEIVGSGNDLPEFSSLGNTIIKGYMTPEQLAREVQDSGVFVLPSRKEPWGVVLHEFAASGLPLIASSACGAATTFLIDGYNGFMFNAGDALELEHVMRRMMSLSEHARLEMGRRSEALAQRITHETAAAQLAGLVSDRPSSAIDQPDPSPTLTSGTPGARGMDTDVHNSNT